VKSPFSAQGRLRGLIAAAFLCGALAGGAAALAQGDDLGGLKDRFPSARRHSVSIVQSVFAGKARARRTAVSRQASLGRRQHRLRDLP